MRVNSPSQAILWKCWLRSYRQLLVITLGVLALLLPLLIMNIVEIDVITRNTVSRYFVFGGLFVLWAACPGITYTARSGRQGAGFVFHEDYTKPISTATLVFIPLVYLCALAVIAYLLPTVILWYLFDLAEPSSVAVFMIVQAVIILSTAQWWTANVGVVWVSWIAIIFLIWIQWMIPGPITVDANGAIIALPLLSYLKPGFLIILSLALLYASVRTQRSGGLVGGDAPTMVAPLGNFRFARYLPLRQTTCPTATPLRAIIWKERQLHGLTNHFVYGVFAALGSLTLVYLVLVTDADTQAITGGQILAYGLLWYLIICVFSMMSLFDISFNGKVARVSPFARTRPISTATMAAIKIAVIFSSLIFTALVMLMTILILSPLFIPDFYAIVFDFWQKLAVTWQYSLLETFGRAVLGLAYLGSVYCLWATAVAWLIINSGNRKLVWYMGSIPAYLLLIYVVVIGTTEPQDVAPTLEMIFSQHLWLFLIGLPLLTLFFMKEIYRNQVLSQQQLAGVIIAAVLIWLLHLIYTLQENIFAPSHGIAVALADTLQGLLPLFVFALVLWTYHRLRHT